MGLADDQKGVLVRQVEPTSSTSKARHAVAAFVQAKTVQ